MLTLNSDFILENANALVHSSGFIQEADLSIELSDKSEPPRCISFVFTYAKVFFGSNSARCDVLLNFLKLRRDRCLRLQ